MFLIVPKNNKLVPVCPPISQYVSNGERKWMNVRSSHDLYLLVGLILGKLHNICSLGGFCGLAFAIALATEKMINRASFLALYYRPVRLSDAGVYECQISTKSKMSHYIKLEVVGKYKPEVAKSTFTL